MRTYGTYGKCVYYLKSTGICIVIIGSCWIFYQLRQTSQILRSVIPVNVLDLEQTRAQYIYIDNPQFKHVLRGGENNLYTSAVKQSRTFSSIILDHWKSLNRMLATRLLYMAQHGTKSERFESICALNSLQYLKDWHYRHMAQVLDARTAVALARMPNVDLRYFLSPPYYHIDYKLNDAIEKVHSLLVHLNKLCDNGHACLVQFLNKNFGDVPRDGLVFDHDLTSVGLAVSSTTVWDQDLLQNCVQAIYHHSSLEEYSKAVIEAGGLPVLIILYKIFCDNIDICILLAKILSNISMHAEYVDDIFRSGWIGILARWTQNNDVRLSAPAGRALVNLDMDDNEHIKYAKRIYLLYPLQRNQTTPQLDVIFLHGLLGGVFVTWRQRDTNVSSWSTSESDTRGCSSDMFSTMIGEQPQEFLKDLARDFQLREWQRLGQDFEVILDDCPEKTNCKAYGPYTCQGDDACMTNAEYDRVSKTQCWPKDWLPQDVPSLRILGINYDTNLSMWTPLCPIEKTKSTIAQRSNEYVMKLIMAGIGKRPIVWVCHSMGGLLVKRMLVEEWKQGDKHNICKNTRGIVFYSTPHRGSHVAALKQATQMLLWPSIEVQELREESPELLKLHEEFLLMLKDFPMEIVSFSETKSTLVTALKFPFQFVYPASADPGVGEFFEIPQDHLSICKPANRQSFLYQKLINILRRHVQPREEAKTSSLMSVLSLSARVS